MSGHFTAASTLGPALVRQWLRSPAERNDAWLCGPPERAEGVQDPCTTTDLNTRLTALYVKIDDEIGGARCLGRPPLLSDCEPVCPAVAQAPLGYHSEARWLRRAGPAAAERDS